MSTVQEDVNRALDALESIATSLDQLVLRLDVLAGTAAECRGNGCLNVTNKVTS